MNQKKLEKAEAKIQKKQGKRSDAPPKEKNIMSVNNRNTLLDSFLYPDYSERSFVIFLRKNDQGEIIYVEAIKASVLISL